MSVSRVVRGTGLRRGMVLAGLVLSLFLTTGATVQARGWSVYIYNTCRPQDGWYRSGFSDDINTSESAALRSIQQRISSAKARGTNREKYIIAYYNRSAPRTLQASGFLAYKGIYNSSARCTVSSNPNPPKCQYPWYIIYRYEGQTGSLGGYRTKAEAERLGRDLNRQQGFRFIEVRYVCR